ncbi:proteic killer suppression protein [Silvimonas terrae]|uniref:Proteic killer suppression protein n=1 Tax=Silvimonas terrae TaxID=300266 RepID=A0A840RDM9_9NEIS|nr:type II toxin-antitoxin system RelE/ParE family toxin [Silvimonas terrae]MBB5190470.1 proteic killer suppression protein [Silvimonas terrae]
MIKHIKHKGLRLFFETGKTTGIQANHAPRLRRQLAQLDAATTPQDMNMPGWRLHPLTENLAGHWAVSVSGSWRMTFRFDGNNAELVEYQDYH